MSADLVARLHFSCNALLTTCGRTLHLVGFSQIGSHRVARKHNYSNDRLYQARSSCYLAYVFGPSTCLLLPAGFSTSNTSPGAGTYAARAARRSDCGGCPNTRIKARLIRFGSRNPVSCAMRWMDSLEDCTRWRATSIRNRSTAFDGVEPVSARKARVKCRELIPACSARSSTVRVASRCSRAQASSGPKRPSGAFNSSSDENCDWPPLRRW